MAMQDIPSLEVDGTVSFGSRGKSDLGLSQSVEGYYLGSKLTAGKYGPCFLHVLDTPEGKLGVWGKTNMDYQLIRQGLEGQRIRITYTGTKPGKNGEMDVFKIQHDPDDRFTGPLPVSQLEMPEVNEATADVSVAAPAAAPQAAAPAAAAPKASVATPPSAARVAGVQGLLNKNKKTT